ncbi:MAG: CPBP family intramembrane metalloprotease [Oscillospiraceae bacterium]|nr:CPBP family intramembrane metalloprotease [Oscillospiraceae bacterium]
MAPTKDEMRQLRRYYSGIAVILIVLIGIFIGVNTLVLRIACGMIGGGFDKEAIAAGREAVRNNAVMTAIYSYFFPFVADIAALCVGLAITKVDLKKYFNVRGFNGKDLLDMTAFGMGLPVIGSLAVVLVSGIVGIVMGKDAQDAADTVNLFSLQGPLWLKMLEYSYVCLLGPIMEELIFRGVMLAGLRKYGNVFAVIMSSVMFGLMHMRFAQCFPAIVIGIVSAVMVIRTGSILPSIFLHVLNNSLSAILMIMREGMDMQKLMDISKSGNMEDMMTLFTAFTPVFVFMGINMLLRFGALIWSGIRIVSFRSKRGVLFGKNEYCTQRTWKPCFTSVPMLLILGYLTVATLVSIVKM